VGRPGTAAPCAATIVVAHRERTAALARNVAAFAREAAANGGEVVVVDGSGACEAERAAAAAMLAAGGGDGGVGADGAAGGAAGACASAARPLIRIVPAPREALVPTLWSLGIREAAGEVVALTLATMRPEPGWLARARARLADGRWAAVGGAIENAPARSPVHWAVYFARYSNYVRPFAEHESDDLPGDNAAYRRDAFAPAQQLVEDAFWEPPVHDRMRRAGLRLLMDPGLVAHHHPAFGLFGFAAQRYRHGRHFGASRAAVAGAVGRAAGAARAPLVPAILMARVVRRLVARRRHRLRFVAATPALCVFFAAWALGEAVGWLAGPGSEPTARSISRVGAS